MICSQDQEGKVFSFTLPKSHQCPRYFYSIDSLTPCHQLAFLNQIGLPSHLKLLAVTENVLRRFYFCSLKKFPPKYQVNMSLCPSVLLPVFLYGTIYAPGTLLRVPRYPKSKEEQWQRGGRKGWSTKDTKGQVVLDQICLLHDLMETMTHQEPLITHLWSGTRSGDWNSSQSSGNIKWYHAYEAVLNLSSYSRCLLPV